VSGLHELNLDHVLNRAGGLDVEQDWEILISLREQQLLASAWGVAVVEASRKAIMEDPAWKDGNYDAPPEKGVRLWRDIVNLLAARTPEMYAAQFKNPLDVLPWLS
jgi:homoserine acetyltransferase